MKIGRNVRIIAGAATACLAIAAPVAQACYRAPQPSPAPTTDVCSFDVNSLLAQYGSRLTAAQKQAILDAFAATCPASTGGAANY